VRFVLIETRFNVGVVPALTNSNNWPRLRIFRPHGLQTRSEYVVGSCNNSNPTLLQISANTTPMLSFLCEGLKRFSEEEYTCLPGNFTLKELLQILELSLARLSDILLHSHIHSPDRCFAQMWHKCDRYTCVNIFVGSKFLASGKNRINFHWLLAHFRTGGQALLITGRSTISQASRAGVIFQVPHPPPPPPPPPLLLCTNPSPVKHSRWRHRKLYLLSRAAPK